MTEPGSEDFKAKEKQTWQAVAAGWRRRDALLRRGAEPATRRMLELVDLRPGDWLLDVASGTGEPAIPAARVVGGSGRVVGTDLVDEMLAVAREKAEREALGNIEFHCIDGEALAFEPGTFDAATSRWGLMFMPEPARCLACVGRLLKDGARMAVACWAAPEENPFVSLSMATLADYMEVPRPPPGAPGIFAFADPDRLESLLREAGFRDIEIEAMELAMLELEEGTGYWDVMQDLAGPVVALVEQLDGATREAYVADLERRSEAFREDGTLTMKGMTWIASCRK